MASNCPECGISSENKSKSKQLVAKYKIPFKCTKCGSLHFPYQALHGIVFIWPKPIEETTTGGIVIPQSVQYNLKTSIGIVLSSGKGCKNKKTGQFVESELEPGNAVVYDKNIPWRISLEASDGKEHEIDLMNLLDVTALYTKENGDE